MFYGWRVLPKSQKSFKRKNIKKLKKYQNVHEYQKAEEKGYYKIANEIPQKLKNIEKLKENGIKKNAAEKLEKKNTIVSALFVFPTVNVTRKTEALLHQ